jgi:hypothetical protein
MLGRLLSFMLMYVLSAQMGVQHQTYTLAHVILRLIYVQLLT